MTCLQKIYDLVSVRRRGSLLLSMFFPTLMFGEPMEASAQQRTYQPTKAQLRLEEQRQQQNAKISELGIRTRAGQTSWKTAESTCSSRH